jgi:hypothetical protein
VRPPRDDFDREVGRLLSEERREDEAAAPVFRELVDARRIGRGVPRRPIGPPVLLRAFAVAAVLIAAAAGVLLTRGTFPGATRSAGGPGTELPASAVAIASWKSPTEFLLDTPGIELLRERPALGVGVPSADLAGSPSPSPSASTSETK